MAKYDKVGNIGVYKKRKSSVGGWVVAAIVVIGILALASGG